MIHFFRRIRQALIAENKTSRYLLYAVGEIALVMVGILLALQVNNWNQSKQEAANIEAFYDSIIDEIDLNIAAGNDLIERDSLLAESHKKALSILRNQQVDSIEVLKDLLGSTATVWGMSFSFPSSQEFLSLDYLPNIENQKIRSNFTTFSNYIKRIDGMNEYNHRQYTNAIEPFFIKHINYAEVAVTRYRDDLLLGGPKTDYTSLFNNMSLWNIVTLKLETLSSQQGMIKNFLGILEEHKSDLQAALDES